MTSEDLSFDRALKDRLFETLIQQAPVAMALFYGPDFVITLANTSVLTYWGRTQEQVLNKPLFVALPEASGQGFEALLTDVLTTGKRYVAKEVGVDLVRHGQLERTYIDFVYDPFYEAGPGAGADRITGVTVVCTEVTQQVLSRLKIDESQAQWLASFEQSPVGIALISSDQFVFRMANAFYQELVGRSLAQLIGRPLFEVLPELQGQGFDHLLYQVIATGIPYTAHEVAVELIRQEQCQTIYVDLMYQPQRDGRGHVSEILVVCTEVTQQVIDRRNMQASEARYRSLSVELDQQVQRRTQELNAANHELTQSNEELRESNSLLVRSNENLQKFAFIASHDLQEPLRKIQSFGDILKTSYALELGTGIDLLNRMQLAASRMASLIRDLLAYSRIATQRENSNEMSLSDIVGLTLSDLDLVIEETGAVVTLGPLPMVEGDPAQLTLLFQNLLSNALKFGQPGVAPRIGIQASWVAAEDLPEGLTVSRVARGYHRIDVVDNGIGFEAKYVDRIFQVFQRLHGKNEYAGTGIGLAICEKVVTNHGGAITASSQPGQGATFTLYLPA